MRHDARNLPANPVYMEQREGRMDRYKNHAARKNLARRHATAALQSAAHDPWQELFSLARSARSEGRPT